MRQIKIPFQIILIVILFLSNFLSACSSSLPNISIPNFLPNNNSSSDSSELPVAKPIIDLPQTIIDFEVKVPDNTPTDEPIFINILDEVTGLALNTKLHDLETKESSDSPEQKVYKISLPFSVGAIIKYRYERQTGNTRVSEHAADGSPIRYRLYYVTGPGKVVDNISRWTDTEFQGTTGRILGKVLDKETNQPIPNLLAVAGGIQTTTKSDGSFIIESLLLVVGRKFNLVTGIHMGSVHCAQLKAKRYPQVICAVLFLQPCFPVIINKSDIPDGEAGKYPKCIIKIMVK